MKTAVAIPFGKHKNKPLPEVPADYLRWCIRECKLSSGIRAAVTAELSSRGVEVPDPPPRPEPRCPTHPSAGYRALWGEDSAGRRFIRCECRQCGYWLGALPLREPYVSQADATARPAPVLDALLGAEAAGVELHSDGKSAWVGGDYRQVPRAVHDAVRQAKHTLGKMIGDNRQEAGRGR